MKYLCLSVLIVFSVFVFANDRPKLKVENNLIYKSILDYHQSKNSDKFQQVVKHLDPLLNYFAKDHPQLKKELLDAFGANGAGVLQEKLANIVKTDIMNVLYLISIAEIQCNESYDLNIAFASYQVISPYVSQKHGADLDKKIKNKFNTILKIHTTDHGGKKHRHCTRAKAEAISVLVENINKI